jgi:hypothetical protein
MIRGRPISAIVAATLLLGVGTPEPSVAQPSARQAPSVLPPGHPSISGSARVEGPKGNPILSVAPSSPTPLPQVNSSGPAALPVGHPPIDLLQPPELQEDSDVAGENADEDAGDPRHVQNDASLPAGTVSVRVRDSRGVPSGAIDVVLRVTHHSVAQGDQVSERTGRTSADGSIQFGGLAVGADWIYRASALYARLDYASSPFQLLATAGKRVSLVVFDTTTNMDALPVGMQAFVLMEPRDDVLQVEELLRVANLGDRTWICEGLSVALDPDFRGFQQDEEHVDLKVEQLEGRGIRIKGFARPGITETSFRYQIPYSGSDSLRFSVRMPPRVAQLRVISHSVGSMTLSVDGMPEPVATRGNQGQRMLVTEQIVSAGGDQIDRAVIHLLGIPCPGPARWYALFMSLAAAIVGLAVALAKRAAKAKPQRPEQQDLERAKGLVLREIARLEDDRSRGAVGPKTYDQSRRALVDTLAHLLKLENNDRPTRSGLCV